MIFKESNWGYRLVSMLLVLALLVPVLAACGDNETPTATTSEATKTTEPTKTVEPTKTAGPPTTTEVPFVNDPVKIGVIQDWSGPMAMAGMLAQGPMELLEWWVNEKEGGLLLEKEGVRRPIKLVKCDMQGTVPGAGACALKLILEEKVSATAIGGWSPAQVPAVADVGEKYKVLHVAVVTDPETALKGYSWTLEGLDPIVSSALAMVKKLQPKTVGYFALDSTTYRSHMQEIKAALEADGIKTVSEQYYTQGTNDFSPYLTRIKHDNPEVLVTAADAMGYQAVYKQIKELGGWGDVKVVAITDHGSAPGAITQPGAVGTYALTHYLYGYGGTGAQEFEQMWKQKCEEDSAWCTKWARGNSIPTPTAMFSTLEFFSVFVAVKAVEYAGTSDPAAVAKAARSGHFEVDTFMGYLKFNTDGNAEVEPFYVQVQTGGKLIPVK